MNETLIDNLLLRIYIKKIKSRNRFKIKTKYHLQLLTPKMIKLLRSTKNKVTEDKKLKIYLIQRLLKLDHCNNVKPIQDGGQKKRPPTCFSSVTSTNVGISPQNFLDFSFNSFCHTGVKFQVCTQYQSQIIELEPRPLLKQSGFSGQILIKLRLW